MDEIYSDITNPGSLSSIDKLYKAVSYRKEDISRSKVKKFLASQPSYTLHRNQPNKFPRRFFLFGKPGDYLLADVTYLNEYGKANSKYILIFMDGFSRYVLGAFPLNTLKAEKVIPCLEEVLSTSIHALKKIFSDRGVEFTNKKFQGMLKKNNIAPYHTFSKIKVSPIEIFNRTLKRKVIRYVSHFNKENFLDDLPILIETYNKTPNAGIMKHRPLDLYLLTNWKDIKNIAMKLYKSKSSKLKSIAVFTVGDTVRIKASSRFFSRAVDTANTQEIFSVCKVLDTVPITYLLADLDKNPIQGVFYKQELTRAIDSGVYDIVVIKSRRRRGKKEYLVNFVHFPHSSPKWLPEEELIKK